MVQQDLANGPDLPNGLVTVGTWLDAFDAESRGLADAPWGERRLQRLHGVQMALDVVAHVHNIPLRLLRLDNLLHLDQTFVRFVTTWEGSVRLLLTEPSADGSRRVPQPLQPAEADALLQAMKQPAHVVVLREWVLRLAAERPLDDSDLAPPVALPPHYAEWFLMLLPHLERDVWLTEMGNPLPVHNLARMVEHWALFILMWAWSQAGRMQAALQPQAGDDGWPRCCPRRWTSATSA
jgi:hypothetical protein